MNKFLVRLKFHPRIFAYATVLVAFFLRVYRLADKNVWWDEGWSIWLSQKDLAWIVWRTAADEHPPLHYWLLYFWNMLAGTDAFAGRFLSVAFGVLTIALVYRLGKKVGGGWLGVLAALFLALARFHIWWSQDIKNYTPSIFFAFAAVWFALQILAIRGQPSVVRSQKSDLATRHSLFGYAICAALAMWTHYLAALVLLALNLHALIVILHSSLILRRPSPVVRQWVISNTLAAALFVPWMYLYLQNAAAWNAAPTFDFGIFLKLVATVLPLGVTTNIDNYAALTIAFTVLAAIPVISVLYSREAFRRHPSSENWTLKTEYCPLSTVHCLLFTLIVAFPPLLVYALSLTPVSFFAPKIQARYLLVLLPAYTMLLALGVVFLSRFSRAFAVFAILFVLGANMFVLNDYYAERRLTDDYATLANTINSFAQPGDLVLLDTDQEWPTFLYYLRAPLEWLGVPNGKAMTDADADALARRALNRNRAVWLVTIPDALATDPRHLLESWLARELPKHFEQTFGDKRLVLYAPEARDLIHVASENFAPQFMRGEKVNADLALLGFDLPVREARDGDTLHVVTYWNARVASAAQPIPVPAGERVRVMTGIFIPPGARGVRVAINGIELANIPVEPRAELARIGNISHSLDYRLGDAIHLVGYDLPQTNFRAGEAAPITLYWRADRVVQKSYTVFVHIVGEQFNPATNNPLWGQMDHIPVNGTSPTTTWPANEIVADAYRVAIDANAPSGKYKIEIGMYDAATGIRLAVDGGGDSITVAEIQVQ